VDQGNRWRHQIAKAPFGPNRKLKTKCTAVQELGLQVPEPSFPLVAILADMLKSALDWETSKDCESSDGDLASVPWVGATGRKRSKKKRKLGGDEYG